MSHKIRHDQIRSVLIAPHISEKTTNLNEKNKQKAQIKKAVEKLFNVKVSAVKTVSVKGKKKRTGMRTGTTKDWKKAYIILAEGQDIDLMGVDV